MSVTPYSAFDVYKSKGKVLNMKRLAQTILNGDVSSVEAVAISFSGFSLHELLMQGLPMPTPILKQSLTPIVCQHIRASGLVPDDIAKHVQEMLPTKYTFSPTQPLASVANNIYRDADAKMASYATARVLDLSGYFRTNVSPDWANAVHMLKGNTHQVGNIFDFLHILHHNSKITFQFTSKGRTIHVPQFRRVTNTLCSNVCGFVIASCSIGLPLQNMYTPRKFVQKWYKSRQKTLTDEFMIEMSLGHVFKGDLKTLEGTRAHQLHELYKEHEYLLRYEPKVSGNIDEYMRDRFYRTPRPFELATMTQRIRSNKRIWIRVPLRVKTFDTTNLVGGGETKSNSGPLSEAPTRPSTPEPVLVPAESAAPPPPPFTAAKTLRRISQRNRARLRDERQARTSKPKPNSPKMNVELEPETRKIRTPKPNSPKMNVELEQETRKMRNKYALLKQMKLRKRKPKIAAPKPVAAKLDFMI